MKSVLVQFICVLITYGCISVDTNTLPPERLESRPVRSETIRDKEEFYISDKQIINEGKEKKIRLTVSRKYENTTTNYYKVKNVTKRTLRHDFSRPMVSIFDGVMDWVSDQVYKGQMHCHFGIGPASTTFPCKVIFFFIAVVPTNLVVYATSPLWYPVQYIFLPNLKTDASEAVEEEKENPEMKSEIVTFDYGLNNRNLRVNEYSYDKGEELINTKPILKDNSIELKLKDLFDIKKHKNKSITKYYNITFDLVGKEDPIRLAFLLNQSDNGNIEIE